MRLRKAPPLAEQTVLITGAALGLGRALAEALADAGARLVLIDFAEDTLRTLAAALPKATAYLADLADEDATRAMIDRVRSRHPVVDTLIHNAGFLRPEPFASMPDALWRRTFNVGIQAAWLLTKAFWEDWQKTGAAAIYVSSRSGIEGFPGEAPYCATKHALEGLVKALAIEGADHGILLHAVTPGRPIHTPMSETNYAPELKRNWVEPSVLAPAFLHLARRTDPTLSGKRLDAWELSRQILSRQILSPQIQDAEHG